MLAGFVYRGKAVARVSTESTVEIWTRRLHFRLPSRPLKENGDAAVTGAATGRLVVS